MFKRMGTALASMALMGLVFAPAYPAFADEAAAAAEKVETVNIATDAGGSVEKVEVEATLKNPEKMAVLIDASTLTDIKGKDDATYSVSGSQILWKAKGKDVTYTGTTSEALPIAIDITYKLDGAEVTPAEIVGKSGRVTIRYDFVNTTPVSAYASGAQADMLMPFTCITALMLSGDRFSDVKVTNGKVIDDGSDSIIAGYAMPGLKRSLGSLADESDIPEYFEVSAQARDFELKSSMTIVTAGLMSDVNTDDLGFDDLDDMSAGLGEGMSKLISGADELTSGMKKLADGADQLSEGADSLSYGAKALSDGIYQLAYGNSSSRGLQGVASSAKEFVNGLGKIDTALSSIADTKQGLPAAANGLSALASSYPNADQVAALKAALKASDLDPASKAAIEGILDSTANVKELSGYVTQSSNGLIQLSGQYSEMVKQASSLPAGIAEAAKAAAQLHSASSTLAKGASDLSSATTEFTSGVHGAADGTDELKEGLVSFDEEGISKIVSTIDDDLGGLKKRLSTLSSAAKSYESFSGKDPATPGSVKFVYETAAIQAG